MTERQKLFVIEPHLGAIPLEFGMSNREVHEVLGKPGHITRNQEFFYRNGLLVEYVKGKLAFIQFSYDCGFEVMYQDCNVMELTASEVIELLSKDATYDKHHPQIGYTYAFPTLDIALWRPVVPADDSDPNGQCFETFSVGEKGYFSDS